MITEKIDAARTLQAKALTGGLGVTAPSAAAKTLKHYRRIGARQPATLVQIIEWPATQRRRRILFFRRALRQALRQLMHVILGCVARRALAHPIHSDASHPCGRPTYGGSGGDGNARICRDHDA